MTTVASPAPFRLPAAPVAADLVAKYFRGLGDPSRLRILELLRVEGELSVGELTERLGLSQPKVSNHLACLRWCGFIEARREGGPSTTGSPTNAWRRCSISRARCSETMPRTSPCAAGSRNRCDETAARRDPLLRRLPEPRGCACARRARRRRAVHRGGDRACSGGGPDDAVGLRFLGSPTVRVDGRDVEPGAEERHEFVFSCRVYRGSRGFSGKPDEAWIRDALREAVR